jgi:hypothetical protein
MGTIMPEGEDLKKAISWISARREEMSDQPLQRLIEQAVFQFDLSPLDQEFLTGFFRTSQNP